MPVIPTALGWKGSQTPSCCPAVASPTAQRGAPLGLRYQVGEPSLLSPLWGPLYLQPLPPGPEGDTGGQLLFPGALGVLSHGSTPVFCLRFPFIPFSTPQFCLPTYHPDLAGPSAHGPGLTPGQRSSLLSGPQFPYLYAEKSEKCFSNLILATETFFQRKSNAGSNSKMDKGGAALLTHPEKRSQETTAPQSTACGGPEVTPALRPPLPLASREPLTTLAPPRSPFHIPGDPHASPACQAPTP